MQLVSSLQSSLCTSGNSPTGLWRLIWTTPKHYVKNVRRCLRLLSHRPSSSSLHFHMMADELNMSHPAIPCRYTGSFCTLKPVYLRWGGGPRCPLHFGISSPVKVGFVVIIGLENSGDNNMITAVQRWIGSLKTEDKLEQAVLTECYSPHAIFLVSITQSQQLDTICCVWFTSADTHCPPRETHLRNWPENFQSAIWTLQSSTKLFHWWIIQFIETVLQQCEVGGAWL